MLTQIKYKNKTFQMLIKDPAEWQQRAWLSGNFYEGTMLKYIEENFAGGTFVDIGSSIGNHTLFFSSVADKVVSIEPKIESLLHNKEMLEANNVKNVDLYNVAGSSFWGLCCMEGFAALDDNNVGLYKVSKNIGFVNVATVPVDFILSRYSDIKMIKVDVEGFELDVLMGLTDTLKKWNPVLFVETVGNPAVFEYLKTLNYVRKNEFNATPTFEFVREEQNV